MMSADYFLAFFLLFAASAVFLWLLRAATFYRSPGMESIFRATHRSWTLLSQIDSLDPDLPDRPGLQESLDESFRHSNLRFALAQFLETKAFPRAVQPGQRHCRRVQVCATPAILAPRSSLNWRPKTG